MLKTMSAALLAASVIAAPAFAQTNDKAATTAPVIKSEKAPVAKTEQTKAPAVKSTEAKSKAMNANAMSHRKHHRHHHKHMSLLNTHVKPVASIKHTHSAAKRG